MTRSKRIDLYKASKVNVAVFGDVMLDEYHFLSENNSKESPEAPGKKVYFSGTREKILGGAANTAVNVSSLGAAASLYAVLGDKENDYGSRQLLDKCAEEVLRVKAIYCPGTRVPVKSRVYIDGEYVFRKDMETTTPSTHYHSPDSYLTDFYWDSKLIDVIVISDYNKGVCSREYVSRITSIAADNNIPVVVDTKPRVLNRYKGTGISLLAINKKEAVEIAGLCCEEEIFTEGWFKLLQKGFDPNMDIAVTAGADGIYGFTRGKVIHTEAYPGGKGDQVGCGDSVKAMMAIGTGFGADLQETLRYAAAAGAVASNRYGTAKVYREDVLEKLGILTIPKSGLLKGLTCCNGI